MNAIISPTTVRALDSIDARFDIYREIISDQVPDIPITTTTNDQDI